MAKAKSTKLRTYITLHALTKYADKDHGLNSITLNDYLRPQGLDCSYKYLKSTIEALREFGVDVRRKNGVWINNRPLTDERLQLLAFALSTNPYITKEQADEVLEGIKPFITVYQEETLNYYVNINVTTNPDDSLYRTYAVIQKALINNAQIKFTAIDSEGIQQKQYTLFTPKSIYRNDSGLYVAGYNHSKKTDEEVDLKSIRNVRPMQTRKNGSNC